MKKTDEKNQPIGSKESNRSLNPMEEISLWLWLEYSTAIFHYWPISAPAFPKKFKKIKAVYQDHRNKLKRGPSFQFELYIARISSLKEHMSRRHKDESKVGIKLKLFCQSTPRILQSIKQKIQN